MSYFTDIAGQLQANGQKFYPVQRIDQKMRGAELYERTMNAMVATVRGLVEFHELGVDFDLFWTETIRARSEKRDPDFAAVLRRLGAQVDLPKQPCDMCEVSVEKRTSILGKLICADCLKKLANQIRSAT